MSKERLLRAAEKILFAIAVPSIVATILLSFLFYGIGSQVPDPTTGRTYPVQVHGILYVTPVLGKASIGLFWLGGFSMVLAMGIRVRRRSNSS